MRQSLLKDLYKQNLMLTKKMTKKMTKKKTKKMTKKMMINLMEIKCKSYYHLSVKEGFMRLASDELSNLK